MKTKFLAMIFALTMLTSISAEEAEHRIYVNPSSVVILDEGFYVEVENEMTGFSSLNIDANGMYVLPSHKLASEWMCGCGWINNYDSQFCRKCGRWR